MSEPYDPLDFELTEEEEEWVREFLAELVEDWE